MASDATAPTVPPVRSLIGVIAEQRFLSSSMIRIDLDLEGDASYAPGQFCMINLVGGAALSLSRPLSILAANGTRLSLLYKIVGVGTRLLADALPGRKVRVLTPLGTPFPARNNERPRLLLAGGVGLPPLVSWAQRYGDPADLFCFGARDGADAPWELLPSPWHVSVDRSREIPDGREAHRGTVLDLALDCLTGRTETFEVLACGPRPLLQAAAEFAHQRGWLCHVSVEERMGCGYGVCRGCVVPTIGDIGWRLACQDGPVLPAADLDWKSFGMAPASEEGSR